MQIQVNIAYIRHHTDMLQRELVEANSLLDILSTWRMQAKIAGMPCLSLVDQQTQTVQRQIRSIQRRISALTKMAEEFSEFYRITGNRLDQVRSAVSSLEDSIICR